MFKIVLIVSIGLYGLEAGKLTHYWDCCKPSCSWPGKASYKTHEPNTCVKDGHTIQRDASAKSGCGNGGTAFMCANQQPWAVNDHLAYGFAAAHLKGKKESDWCCACYEITFQSGAANGKRLVVQVTNTGGDLEDDHFDLQIPGGGVGLFNGCVAQYNSPKDGWGQRYGGVGDEGQCNQLPKDLQPGCHWRFQWLKNSDNSAFSFKRVKCPAEITARTGCVRNDDHFY